MTSPESIFPHFSNFKEWIWINPEVDREMKRQVRQLRLWRVLRGRAVCGVFFDVKAILLRLKITRNGRDFKTVRIDPRTLDFSTSPTQPDEIWLSLHYRWLRVDRIQWKLELLSIQCTGDWTTFLNVKRSNRRGLWHLWLPF